LSISKPPDFAAPVHGTPDMGVNLGGASPPVRKRDLNGGQYTKCNPPREVLGEGNCGEATNRGEEACECGG